MRRTIILAALTACRLFAGETAKVAANATADFGDYTYDGAGNITGAGADRFTYDEYGRIKAAALTQGSTTITQSFGYDRYGNLLSIATTGDPTLVPAVDPLTNRINKLTATTNAFGSYDANGNLTSYNSSSSFAYDPLDVMSESTVGGQRRVYLYTAGNERIAVLEVTATGALTGSTWTLRDASAKVLRKLSKDGAGTWSWDEDYIYRGAQLLAAEVPGNTLQFHLDHLGTPRVITGNGGARLSSHTYFPFGREVAAFSTPDAEVMKFTGHERDDVNLDYMHARYYMPFAGRFLSVDPHLDIKENLREPQRWNRYAYVTNNPLRYTDPDGRDRYQEPGFTKPYSEWGEALQMDESTPTVVKAANYAAGGLTALGAAGFMGAGSALTSVARFATAYASRLTTSATAAEMTRRVVSDSNRMNHIFGNPGHKLDGLVRAFGSTDKVVGAVSRAVLSAGKLQTNANGVFSVVVKVGGQNVEVRGRVIKDAI